MQNAVVLILFLRVCNHNEGRVLVNNMSDKQFCPKKEKWSVVKAFEGFEVLVVRLDVWRGRSRRRRLHFTWAAKINILQVNEASSA
jgi:hypothetical protein